jgi:DNA-binding CsgD family transcriptional regulator
MASHSASTPIEVGGPHRSGWPLIGRDDVLDVLTTALARRGPGSLVLSGQPGVGRSRLAHEALAWAQAAGFATEWFVATRAAASIPFGAFARMLDGPDLEGSDRLTLFLSAVEVLAERAGRRRLVVAVDDAHLLDQAGAALLHQVAATGTAFVAATVCSGQPVPEPIVALGRDGLGTRIDVAPLTAADLERLLEAALDGPVDGGTLHDLVTSAAGSLSFLSELVAAGLESRALVRADGIWRWSGPLGSHPRLLAVVESHLGGLSVEERGLVELLAAAEPLELALLERLVPAAALESAEGKGLLEVVRDDQRVFIRLAQPVHGEASRATTSPLRVRALRRRLSSALRATGCRRHGDALRHAAWRLDGGETVGSRELLAAAGQAASCSDHRLAERLSRAAISAGGGCEATRLLSRALIEQGRLEEVDVILGDPAAPGQVDIELVRAVLSGAVNLYLTTGVDVEGALGRSEPQLCRVRGGTTGSDTDVQAETGVLLALRALTASRPEAAQRAADAVLQLSGADEPARLRAVVIAALALAAAGRTGEALAAVARGATLAPRGVAKESQASLWLLTASTVAHRHAGNLVEAEALASSGYRRTLLARNDAARTLWSLLLGRVALDRGQVRTAARWFREGAALSRAILPLGQLPWCLAHLAVAAGQAGDAETAEAALAEAEELAPAMKPPFESELILAQAWTAAACGETSRAMKLALEAGEIAWERGQLSFAASAFHDAVRLGGGDEAQRRLTDVVPALDGRWAPVMLAHATALEARDGPGLDTVSVAFEAMGAILLAAEAATEAAMVHRRHGKPSSSLVANDRARMLHGLCEGARTPALEQIESDVLTRREREVTVLAARGLSNRDIADLLVVSVRTIENQLHRAYGKLGVAGREELATALGTF